MNEVQVALNRLTQINDQNIAAIDTWVKNAVDRNPAIIPDLSEFLVMVKNIKIPIGPDDRLALGRILRQEDPNIVSMWSFISCLALVALTQAVERFAQRQQEEEDESNYELHKCVHCGAHLSDQAVLENRCQACNKTECLPF